MCSIEGLRSLLKYISLLKMMDKYQEDYEYFTMFSNINVLTDYSKSPATQEEFQKLKKLTLWLSYHESCWEINALFFFHYSSDLTFSILISLRSRFLSSFYMRVSSMICSVPARRPSFRVLKMAYYRCSTKLLRFVWGFDQLTLFASTLVNVFWNKETPGFYGSMTFSIGFMLVLYSCW